MTIHRMGPIRVVASQLLAAAAIAMSLTTAAQASAERSWDIEAYDRCMANGNDVGWRFREMLRYVHPLTTPEKTRALVSVEGFVALNDTDWGATGGFDQARSFAGVEVPIGGKSTLEIGYLNQAINDPNRRIRMNHIASLALFIRP